MPDDTPFDPAAYGPAVADLLTPPRLAELGPGRPDPARFDALARFDPLADLGPVIDPAAALACHAALWLHHDFAAESHAISQALATPEGGYWHAILHRREPDAFNAKYWFRQVGAHPVLQRLALQSGYATPTRFVDLCEQLRGSGGVAEERARRLQWLEWRLLFDHCFRLAVGEG